MRKHILALGENPTIQHTLWQAFGNEVEVMYNDGHQPIFNLMGDILPDVILADVKLFRKSDLGNQIKGDGRVAGVPLLLLADETEMVPDDQLARWGVVGIINQPVDIEELKLKVGSFLDAYAATDDLSEISIDEFRLDNLDEELRNLSQGQEPPSQVSQVGNGETNPNNDIYTKELDQILAEIDEIPSEIPFTEQKEEAEIKPSIEQKAEPKIKPSIEQKVEPKIKPSTEQKEEAEMKPEESLESMEEMMAVQEPAGATPKIEMEEIFSTQSTDRVASPGMDRVLEQWFRSIAEEKITKIIAHENFGRIIEKVAHSVVPRIAEELVGKEIERIKKKISGE